jgi:protein-serine/threonine kinase
MRSWNVPKGIIVATAPTPCPFPSLFPFPLLQFPIHPSPLPSPLLVMLSDYHVHPHLPSPPSSSSSSQTHVLPRSPSTTSWKSKLRFGNPLKRLAINPTLKLDTRSTPSSAASSFRTPVSAIPDFPPQPTSNHRTSNHSSSTQSSDSLGTPPPTNATKRGHEHAHYPYPFHSPIDGAHHSQARQRTKSEKQRIVNARSPNKVNSAHPLQSHYHFSPAIPSKPSAQFSPPASPKTGIGASATRFLRRVASAPNVKNLFSSGSRSATVKNGMLVPAEPLPTIPATTADQGGTDSSETLSSSSCLGRSTRLGRSGSSAPRASDGIPKAPFRRTYSSNSIKVRSVSGTDVSMGAFFLSFSLFSRSFDDVSFPLLPFF